MKYFYSVIFFVSFISCNSEEKITSQNVMEVLKEHYQFNKEFNKFSISFKFSGAFGPQSFDYRKPENSYRSQATDLDIEKKHFFTAMKRGDFPGGFLFEANDFQNDSLSLRYDVNGVLYGKMVLKRELTSFERELEEVNDIVDFLAVKPLLENKEKQIKTRVDQISGIVFIEQIGERQDTIVYTFKIKPIQLQEIYNKKDHRKRTFNQYTENTGLSYASRVIIHEENFINQYEISKLEKNNGISPEKLAIPKGYGPVIEDIDHPLRFDKIASDIFLISNVDYDRNVLLKVDANGIMVFGAPGRDDVSEDIIGLIKREFPNKKINYVYVTHPHSDHIGGLTAYAKRGVVIVADAYTIEAIRAFDRFLNDIQLFKFQAIKHRELFNGVRFYIPKNSHALGQSFAYFEKEGIIYEGDFLEIPFDNTIATYMSQVEREFVDFIRAEKLNIKRIVGHHRNNNISKETMDKYYSANVK